MGYVATHFIAELLFVDSTLFKSRKRPCLTVIAEKITDISHSQIPECLLTILAADIHDHAAQVKQ